MLKNDKQTFETLIKLQYFQKYCEFKKKIVIIKVNFYRKSFVLTWNGSYIKKNVKTLTKLYIRS